MEALADSLSGEERRRAEACASPHLRRRQVVGRGRLRALLGAYLGPAPASLVFEHGPFGKPELGDGCCGSPARRMRFNLAHAGDRALLALAWNRSLGIDLEPIRPLEAMADLAREVCSETEQAELRSLPERERAAAFLRAWTCKEAVAKGLGLGLGLPLGTLEVLVPGGPPARLRPCAAAVPCDSGSAAASEGGTDGGTWTLLPLSIGAGWSAALAIEGSAAVTLRHLRWGQAPVGTPNSD